jgi:hypothetical protein
VVAGNHLSDSANTDTSSIATQKLGIAMPSVAMVEISRSSQVPWRSPARTPEPTPMTTASTIAVSARASVGGAASRMLVVTGRPVNSDSPRSPRNTPPSHDTYCSTTGRFSPSCSRIRSTSATVAFSPAMTSAGSPGMSLTMRKVRSETSQRTSSPPPTRRMTIRAFIVFSVRRWAVETQPR